MHRLSDNDRDLEGWASISPYFRNGVIAPPFSSDVWTHSESAGKVWFLGLGLILPTLAVAHIPAARRRL